MPRGGQRDGAGRKSTWPSGCSFEDTKLIRVPAHLSEELLDFAKELDKRKFSSLGIKYEWVDVETQRGEVEVIEQPTQEPVKELKFQMSFFGGELQPENTLNDLVTDSEEVVNDLETKSIPAFLNATQLSERLGIPRRSLERYTKKDRNGNDISREECIAWTKSKDPDGFGWEYRSEDKKYYRVNP